MLICGEFLRTDRDGRFIIYPGPSKNARFFAAPGYPVSQLAWMFAGMNNGLVECEARAVEVSNDCRFFVLTCPCSGNYDERKFHEFLERKMPAFAMPRRPPPRVPLVQFPIRPGEGSVEYKVRNPFAGGRRYSQCDRAIHGSGFPGL